MSGGWGSRCARADAAPDVVAESWLFTVVGLIEAQLVAISESRFIEILYIEMESSELVKSH